MVNPPPALSIDGLSVAYDARPVLWDASLAVQAGVMMGIVGPNGAGKSTLLRAALGILPTLAGEVRTFGKRLKPGMTQVGYVPQRSAVDWDFPTTVFDLVQMGTYGRLGWLRRPGPKQREETLAALKMVEMDGLADRQISELSGGQQQRIFLARAFVQDAPILFMDEPFAGVDATTEKAIVTLLQQLRSRGKTLLVVHHDLTTVRDYFDQVTLLNRRVIASGIVGDTFTRENIERTYGGSIAAGVL